MTTTTTPGRTARPLPPTRTATRMFLRELTRRWRSVLFMLFMPTAYFAVSYLTADPDVRVPLTVTMGDLASAVTVAERDLKSLYLAVLGLSVTGAFAALTTVRGSSAAVRRLRLVGFGARQLLSARLLVLLAITVAATAIFMAIFLPLVGSHAIVFTALALLQVGLIGVGLGTLLGMLFTREFEPAMIIVAISGIQLAVGRSDSAGAEKYLLYTPAVDALKTATFTTATDLTALWLGFGYTVVLFGISYVISGDPHPGVAARHRQHQLIGSAPCWRRDGRSQHMATMTGTHAAAGDWLTSYMDQASAGTLAAPPSAWWIVTRACNLSCYYCFADARKRDPDELNTDEAKRVLDDFADNGVMFVTFLGGEPLTRRDIFELVDYSTDLGIYTAMLTNGLNVKTTTVDRLIDAGLEMIGVSIDSQDPAVHDAVRGKAGSLAGAKGVLHHAIQRKLRCSVRIVVTEDSYAAIPDLFRWAIDEGIEELILLPVFMVGRAAGGHEDRRADIVGKELFLLYARPTAGDRRADGHHCAAPGLARLPPGHRAALPRRRAPPRGPRRRLRTQRRLQGRPVHGGACSRTVTSSPARSSTPKWAPCGSRASWTSGRRPCCARPGTTASAA